MGFFLRLTKKLWKLGGWIFGISSGHNKSRCDHVASILKYAFLFMERL